MGQLPLQKEIMNHQEQLDAELLSAVHFGNVEELKDLISKGANPNAKDHSGNPLMLCAAQFNEVEVVRYLVNDVHIPTEVRDKHGRTALLAAASRGALDVVQFLISIDANILARNALDETALHLCARTESVETFKFLQQSGVPIDALDIRGRTVLHHAAEFAYPKMVEYILQGGWVAVDCLDKNGQTPLMLTADFPRHEQDPINHSSWFNWDDGHVNQVIKLLLNAGADLTIKDVLERNALHRTLGNRDNFTFLLEKFKEFIHSVDKKGQTPIVRALTAFRNSWYMPEVFSLLLKAGADLKSCDSEGRSPLYIASEKECHYQVPQLIKSGAETSCLEKDSLTKILHIAVWNNDFELTSRMLSEGADINGRNSYNRSSPSTEEDHTIRCLGCYDGGGYVYYELSGESPLFQALKSVKILKLLIDAGADVNFKDDHGCTPLHTAVDYIHYEALEMLLDAGADPNIVDDCGVTPIHITSCKQVKGEGITKFTERLLQAGANVNVADHNGRTPIHYAARKGHWMNMAVLLKAGANVNAVDVNGATSLLLTGKRHDTRIIRLLVDAGANVNLKDDHCCSPLQIAVNNRNFEALEILLNAGADPNAVDEFGVSVLHTISSRPVDVKDTLKFMKRLVKAGANVNLADHNGITPLHCAAKAGNCELIKFLLGVGADVNSMDENGATPLLMIAKHSYIKAAQLLLDAGANLTASDKSGQQIIHQASEVGDTTAIDYLMEKWTSTWGCDSSGNTVLHFATRSGKNRLMCIEHILRKKLVSVDERNVEGQTALAVLVGHGSKLHSTQAEVQILLAEGASPTTKDNSGKTPLHTASSVNDIKVMESLIEAGADVTVKDATGRTPLHWAATALSVEGLELLLQKTANVEEQDNDGQTPLMLTVGSSATVSLLLRKGASVSVKDNSGKTALEEAMDLGSHGAVKLLWTAVTNLTDVPQESCFKAVHLAVKAGDVEMLDHLISLGISLSDCWWDPKHETTLLHCAAESSVEMLKKLIDSGHTESVHDQMGCSPLHRAVQSLNFVGTKCLLADAHVPVNDRDADSRTALMLAVSSDWYYPDVFDMLAILVNAGADINAQDKDGKTAYDLAYYAWADMTHDLLDYMQLWERLCVES